MDGIEGWKRKGNERARSAARRVFIKPYRRCVVWGEGGRGELVSARCRCGDAAAPRPCRGGVCVAATGSSEAGGECERTAAGVCHG